MKEEGEVMKGWMGWETERWGSWRVIQGLVDRHVKRGEEM